MMGVGRMRGRKRMMKQARTQDDKGVGGMISGPGGSMIDSGMDDDSRASQDQQLGSATFPSLP